MMPLVYVEIVEEGRLQRDVAEEMMARMELV
jgi:hypothetical protein